MSTVPSLWHPACNKILRNAFMKSMKKTAFALLLAAAISACNSGNKNGPDVSGIKVSFTIDRYDQAFFSIDSNNVRPGLDKVYSEYPAITPIFLGNILGLDSASTLAGVKSFLGSTGPMYNRAEEVFKDQASLEAQFRDAFQHVNYYFPNYALPRHIVTLVGPPDALAQTATGFSPDFLGEDFLGIGMQFYLGADYPIYSEPFFIENVVPRYRSRRFSREYVVADAMQLIADDLFPDRSQGKPLIEQMIERGKQWWLLDQLLPATPDSIKTGYTQQQLDWCNQHEADIWSFLVTNEKDLYTVNQVSIQTYIGEGPFTQGMPQESSPGNIGQWIGWQIVKKYVAKNPGIKPEDLMNTPARKILEEAKYKPR